MLQCSWHQVQLVLHAGFSVVLMQNAWFLILLALLRGLEIMVLRNTNKIQPKEGVSCGKKGRKN
ncbi:hypothetical protein AR688_10705 [Rheinheimera sp. EpRS3]|nr:hypothetical protein AR688_10705 [Rheinheimera sp. EpRS3]